MSEDSLAHNRPILWRSDVHTHKVCEYVYQVMHHDPATNSTVATLLGSQKACEEAESIAAGGSVTINAQNVRQLLDGVLSTMQQRKDITEDDYKALEGCSWRCEVYNAQAGLFNFRGSRPASIECQGSLADVSDRIFTALRRSYEPSLAMSGLRWLADRLEDTDVDDKGFSWQSVRGDGDVEIQFGRTHPVPRALIYSFALDLTQKELEIAKANIKRMEERSHTVRLDDDVQQE